jgi:hypothetical protein
MAIFILHGLRCEALREQATFATGLRFAEDPSAFGKQLRRSKVGFAEA